MKYVALLRGVNVGGQTVKSAELKNCFEKAGYKNVQTVLATGNVIFESDDEQDKLKPKIETLLAETFNYPARVCVLASDKLAKIIADYPFYEPSPNSHRYVIFLAEQPDALALASIKLDDNLEAVQPDDKVIYWKVLKRHTLDSDFAKYSAKTASKEFSTTRNLNTLEKILARSRSDIIEG